MPFITQGDVEARLLRPLTTTEATYIDALITQATDAISAAVDKTTDWSDELDPVPAAITALCVTLVTRVLLNPAGAQSTSETLGSHQYSASYGAGTAGLTLTTAERLEARRAVYGSTTGSARLGALIDECAVVSHFPSMDVETQPEIDADGERIDLYPGYIDL